MAIVQSWRTILKNRSMASMTNVFNVNVDYTKPQLHSVQYTAATWRVK